MKTEKFGAEDILALLPKLGYRAIYKEDGSNAALYYEKGSLLVFPPVSDLPVNGTLKCITATLEEATHHSPTLMQNRERLFFPVLEEQTYGGKPRGFWVILMYDFNNNTMSMLDPTGYMRASSYNTGPMASELEAALQKLNVRVDKALDRNHLAVQPLADSVFSGHWICYFLHKFSEGLDLAVIKKLKVDKQCTHDLMVAVLTGIDRCTSVDRLEGGGDSFSTHPADAEESVLFPPLKEKQRYATHLTAVHCDTFNIDADGEDDITRPSAPELGAAYFQWNLYAALMLSGMALVVLGVVCLAGQVAVLPPTGAAVLLGVGTVTFFSGVIGKSGLFDARSPLSAAQQGHLQPTLI